LGLNFQKTIESVEALLTIHGCSGCPNFKELLSFILAKKRKKERKPQYGPSMVVGVVATFKNFCRLSWQKKKRKKGAIRFVE
jgi:hypothetical protein